MSDPGNPSSPLTEILPLLPDLRELENLRQALLSTSRGDGPNRGDPVREYATIEDRGVDAEAVEEALRQSEEELRQQIKTLYGSYRELLHAKLAANNGAVVRSLLELGDAEYSQNRHGSARRFFEIGLAVSQQLGDPGLRVQALRRIGRVAHRSGELPDALLYYERSAKLAIDMGETREAVIASTGAGNVLCDQGSWSLAEERYRAALQIVHNADEALALEAAQIWHNLALVNKVQGRFAEAEACLERARELLVADEQPQSVAFAYHSLADIRSRQGRFAEARELCRKALALPNNSHLRAIFASDLAAYLLADGRNDEAREVAREAEEYAIAARSPYALGAVYQELGNVHRADGDEEAWIFYERALEITRRHEFRKLEAEILLDYALQRDGMDEHEEARAYRERAVELFREMGAAAAAAHAEQALAAGGEASAARGANSSRVDTSNAR